MRKRSASESVAQRGGARGDARTMLRWLWAAILLAAADAGAWDVPQSLLLTPRTEHQPNATTRYLHIHGWHLELQENTAIRAPHYNHCQFYKGTVLNENKSTATVTECHGQLYGLLHVAGEEFVLQPTRSDGSHVLHRRDVLLAEHPAAYNLTGDTVTDLDLEFDEYDEPKVMPHVRPRHSDSSDTQYFQSMSPISRPIGGVQGLWLELAIVADHTMLKFHGRERVKHYILALMNIVSAIFNDPSLNSNMTLVINKLYLIDDKEPIIKYGNVKKSLELVNKWNYKRLRKLPPGSTAWDAMIWLTRASLGGPSGFAPVGGVCSNMRSAAIDRDEGLTSAFVVAHELAHLLGLTHDGDGHCPTEALRGTVMAPTVLATLHNYAWSACSKDQFHEKSWKWWCLHERSKEKGVELGGAREISHYTFSMDEQCRTEFGEGFSICKSLKVRSACSRLWCAHRSVPNVCRSKRAPPLEGTPCGHNKWCVNQVCEPMPGHGVETKLVVGDVDKPEWGDWGAWSECSADCGYGMRSRIRQCRYRGSFSESACEGAGSQVSTCWAGSSCAATRDIRADLCFRQEARFIPYLHPNETRYCEIWCVDYEGSEPSNFGALPDGTPCSYEKPFDVCFQGTCVKGQCNSSDPACNWCPDGYCNNNTHIYSRKLGKGWTRMTMIPHEAHQLSVHIATPVPVNIALRERKRDKHVLELRKHAKRIDQDNVQDNYLKYDPNVPQNLQIVEIDNHVIDIKEDEHFYWKGEVVAAGTLLQWKQTDSEVFITSKAQLQTDLMIMAIPENSIDVEEMLSVEVSVNYSTPAGRTRPLEYRYSTERGPCSSICGGGMRVVRPRCLREQKCPLPRFEPCNEHKCEYVWASGEWEECSATCGSDGVRERQLFCVPANISTPATRRDLISNSVSPTLCLNDKPDRKQPCNQLPCPVYWREKPWTECSATCGRGISRKPMYCPAPDEYLCGPKPRERRRRCRARRCPISARKLTICPATDTSLYCEAFTVEQLHRNCEIPSFKKYCCSICRDLDHRSVRSLV